MPSSSSPIVTIGCLSTTKVILIISRMLNIDTVRQVGVDEVAPNPGRYIVDHGRVESYSFVSPVLQMSLSEAFYMNVILADPQMGFVSEKWCFNSRSCNTSLFCTSRAMGIYLLSHCCVLVVEYSCTIVTGRC